MRFGRQRVAVDQFAANDGVAYLPRDEFRSPGNPDGLRIATIADGNCDKSVRQVKFLFGFSAFCPENGQRASARNKTRPLPSVMLPSQTINKWSDAPIPLQM